VSRAGYHREEGDSSGHTHTDLADRPRLISAPALADWPGIKFLLKRFY
jgi:hypothetical protein